VAVHFRLVVGRATERAGAAAEDRTGYGSPGTPWAPEVSKRADGLSRPFDAPLCSGFVTLERSRGDGGTAMVRNGRFESGRGLQKPRQSAVHLLWSALMTTSGDSGRGRRSQQPGRLLVRALLTRLRSTSPVGRSAAALSGHVPNTVDVSWVRFTRIAARHRA
jgi:hypothetical protein